MMVVVKEDRDDEQASVAASVVNRLAARFLDGLLFVPITLVLNEASGAGPDGSDNGAWPLTSVILSFVSFMYEAVLTWRFGQTLGKRLLGMRS